MIPNPFDSDENLQAWFDLNPEYRNAKRRSFLKYVEKNNLKTDFTMSLKEQYLNTVNFITKNTILATLLMVLVVAGATVTAAEIVLPKTSEFKPSTILQNSFGKTAPTPAPKALEELKPINETKTLDETNITDEIVAPTTPIEPTKTEIPQAVVPKAETQKPVNEPYIKLTSAKHWDDGKALNDPKHLYNFFYESKGFDVDNLKYSEPSLKNNFEIKVYDGNTNNIPKTKPNEYSIYRVFPNYSEIGGLSSSSFSLYRENILNFKQVCTIVLQNEKILENTKSCIALPENRPSTLLQIADISNSIKCPESIDISKTTEFTCQINLPKDKTLTDPLYFRDTDFNLNSFTLSKKSLIVGKPTLKITDCTNLNNEIKCNLDNKLIELLKSGSDGYSSNLTFSLQVRNWDTVRTTIVGPEIQVIKINPDTIPAIAPVVASDFVFNLKHNQNTPDIPLKGVVNYQNVEGIVDLTALMSNCTQTSIKIVGKVNGDKWSPQNIIYNDSISTNSTYFNIGESRTSSIPSRPCLKIGKTNDLKLKLNKNGETNTLNLSSYISPLGYADQMSSNQDQYNLKMNTVKVVDISTQKNITQLFAKDLGYGRTALVQDGVSQTNNQITLGDAIKITITGITNFDSGQPLENQDCGISFDKKGYSSIFKSAPIQNGSCEITVNFDSSFKFQPEDKISINVSSLAFNMNLSTKIGEYTVK